MSNNDKNAPAQPAPDTSEQRQEYRLTAEETVYLEVEPALAENQSATIVVSTSLDMSANGLRVITDQELVLGKIMRTCVLLRASGQQFLLITEVKWARSYGDAGEFLLGLSLYESEGSDIQRWKEFIASACESEQGGNEY